jgi:PAS domain S-box-containing protein
MCGEAAPVTKASYVPSGDGFLRSVLDASLDCIKVVELDGRLTYMNANGLCAMEIDDFAQVSNACWWDLWPADGAIDIKNAIEAGRKGQPTRFEAFCPTAKGTPKWWDVSVSPVRDDSGRIGHLVSISRDITDRKRAEEALADSETRAVESEQQLHAIVDSIDQMIWSATADGQHDFHNRRWQEFTGSAERWASAEAWIDLFHADDREGARTTWRSCVASGEPFHIEARLRHSSGEYRWVLCRAQCVRDQYGKIVRWYGTCTDIHDLKAAQESNELLARELAHRIKNIFAVISGLIALSAREQPELRPLVAKIQERIGALSIAHEYVRPHSPDSAPREQPGTFQGLLRLLLAPYMQEGQERIEIDGPDAAVGPKSAAPIALVLHELATNAAKYGALSSPTGRLSIACQPSDDSYEVLWQEDGGPAVAGAPQRTGFGTVLSDRILIAQLSAEIFRAWRPQGLELKLVMPADKMQL